MSTQRKRRVLATVVAGTALLLSGTAVAQTPAGLNDQADGQRTAAGTNVANQAEVQFQKLSATGASEGPQIVKSDNPDLAGEEDPTSFTVDHLIDLQLTKANADVTFDRDNLPAEGLLQVLTLTNKGNADDEYHIDIDLAEDNTLGTANGGFAGEVSVYHDVDGSFDLTAGDVLLSSMDNAGTLTIHNQLDINLLPGDTQGDNTPAFILSNDNDAGNEFGNSQTPNQVQEASATLLFVTNTLDNAASSAPVVAASPPNPGSGPILPAGVESGEYTRYVVNARSFDSVIDDAVGDRDATDITFSDDVLVGDTDGNDLRGDQEKVIVDAIDEESASQFVIDNGIVEGDGNLTAARDGQDAEVVTFIAQAVDSAFAKEVTVLCDPINGTTNPYAIPGAYVNYTLTITVEATSEPALYTVLTDNLPNDVIFDSKGISGTSCQETPLLATDPSVERDGDLATPQPIQVTVCDADGTSNCVVSHHLVADTNGFPITLGDLQSGNVAALTGALPDFTNPATLVTDLAAFLTGSGLAPPGGTPFAAHLPSTANGNADAGGTLVFTLPAFSNIGAAGGPTSNPAGGIFQPNVSFEISFNAYIR